MLWSKFCSQLFFYDTIETMGPVNVSACQLFADVGRKISLISGEGTFVCRRVLVPEPSFYMVSSTLVCFCLLD